MSDLFVLKVKDEATAQQMLTTLESLQHQQLVQVEDAAIVTRQLDGKPKIKQATDLVGAGALGGAFWGMIVGMFFLAPLLGAVVGAAAGAISGTFTDFGINDDFIKEVSQSIQPGESALFLLVGDAVADKVLPKLKHFQFEVMQTSLSYQDEAMLREMLGTEA